MAFFDKSYKPVIEGGQFANVLHGDANFHIIDPKASSTRGLESLHQNVAAGAFYDAAERVDPPKCHPQTRLAILTEIQEWVRSPEARKRFIIWIYGPAGSGKSAIAQTIAEIFAQERALVASFFFSRTGIGRNDTARFIASIAYQLSLSIPEVRAHIASAVDQDPFVFTRTLLSQMHTLVIQPLNAAAAALAPADLTQPRLVIVDGLDEAREETSQKDLLEALAAAIQQLQIPLIFLVASRPEYVIRQAFNKQPLQSLMQSMALDEHYKPDDDIRIFLFAKFDEIRETHPSGNTLPVPWPTKEDMDYLVLKASGQFIYASTIMKYINSPRHNPTRRLKIILGLSGPGKDTPFAQLDALYNFILSSVDDITRVLEILALVFLQTGYDSYLSVEFIETLLGYDSGDVAAALTDMHALVHVPSSDDDDDDEDRLHMYHASLHDFLMDKSRTERFFLDARVRHADLARHLFRYITTVPKSEYNDYRFLAILNGFINHYLEGSNTEALVADLKAFSLTKLLSDIPLEAFYAVKWDAFFDHLQSECRQTNADLYQRLRDEFDDWIRSRYEQYPEPIQHCISAACAIPATYAVVYLPDLFDILAHNLPASDALALRKLDRGLFVFQEMSSFQFADFNRHSVLPHFFSDPARAGVHFADKAKFGKLVEEIVKLLCRRGDDRLPVVVESRPYSSSPHSPDLEWCSTLKIEFGNLEFFPKILAAAPEDPKLAQYLWELAVQYKDDDTISDGRKRMADASLDYIRRSGISIPQHVHQAECAVCANYKPAFPIPPLEPEEKVETTEYTISTPDEPATSQSAYPTNAPEHTLPKSPTTTLSTPSVIAPSASSSRSLNISSSPSTTRNRSANAPSSTPYHFSNSPSTPPFSPTATRSAGATSKRPSSAEPSTSSSTPASHRPSSNSLSATSRGRPPNPASSSSSSGNFLSPYSPPTSTFAQTSLSSLPQPKGRFGRALSREAAASAEALPQHKPPTTTANTPKRPIWKRMWHSGK